MALVVKAFQGGRMQVEPEPSQSLRRVFQHAQAVSATIGDSLVAVDQLLITVRPPPLAPHIARQPCTDICVCVPFRW